MLDRGGATLDPPLPGDHPPVSAAAAWAVAEPTTDPAGPVTTETRRLLLTRYSATLPATVTSHGLVPQFNGLLAWVVYEVPLAPDCGLWGVTVVDAHSGRELVGDGYAPGP